MPKVEADYSKTVIYHFVCNDEQISDKYVGHTTNKIQRKNKHKSRCTNEQNKNYHLKIYETIRDNGGWENWRFVILEEFPCQSKTQAEIREEFWRKQLNATMNTNKAHETREEYLQRHREEMKKYRLEDPEHYKQSNEKYQLSEKGITKRNEYEALRNATKTNCPCGCAVISRQLARHENTQKHQRWLNQVI